MPEPPAPPAQPTEAELRELLMRGEQLRQQLSALETQREYVLELLTDARRAHMTVEHLAKAQDGEEILLPVGAGTFVHARLARAGTAITSLGSGVHAELPAGDAKERLKSRVDNLESAANALGKDIARVSDEMARLNALAESFYGG